MGAALSLVREYLLRPFDRLADSEDVRKKLLGRAIPVVRDVAILAALSPYPFCGVRGQARHVFLFREGRCTEGFPNPIHEIYLTEENYVYGDLYLNAEGMILSNGDLSYVRQRQHALCPCGKLMQYLRMTLKKRQKERLYE